MKVPRDWRGALKVLDEINAEGYKPTLNVFRKALYVVGRRGKQLEATIGIYSSMKKLNIKPDIACYNILFGTLNASLPLRKQRATETTESAEVSTSADLAQAIADAKKAAWTILEDMYAAETIPSATSFSQVLRLYVAGQSVEELSTEDRQAVKRLAILMQPEHLQSPGVMSALEKLNINATEVRQNVANATANDATA